MTAILILAFRSVIADVRRSILYVLTIGFLLMVISAPIAIANGYAENLYSMLPKYEQERVLLINVSATSLSDSLLDYLIIERLTTLGFKDFFPQILFYSRASFNDNLFDIRVRGVDRLDEYFKRNRFRVDGSIPSSSSEVAVGVLLARKLGIKKDTSLRIFLDHENFKDLRVSGIIDCKCPSDEDVLVSLVGAWDIKPSNLGKFSFVEVIDLRKVDLDILHSLNVKVLYEKPFHQAAYDLIFKTFNSVKNWSFSMYLLVLVAVYFTAVKIARESEKDVAILRCIGASRWKAFSYLFYRCLIVAVLGIIVGLAFGVVFAQVTYRFVSIILSTGSYTPPSLYVSDVVWLMGISLLSSISGILYPTLKEVRRNLGDLTWRLTYP